MFNSEPVRQSRLTDPFARCLIDLIACYPPPKPLTPSGPAWSQAYDKLLTLLLLHARRSKSPLNTAQHRLNLAVPKEWNNTELTSRRKKKTPSQPTSFSITVLNICCTPFIDQPGARHGSVLIYAKRKKKEASLMTASWTIHYVCNPEASWNLVATPRTKTLKWSYSSGDKGRAWFRSTVGSNKAPFSLRSECQQRALPPKKLIHSKNLWRFDYFIKRLLFCEEVHNFNRYIRRIMSVMSGRHNDWWVRLSINFQRNEICCSVVLCIVGRTLRAGISLQMREQPSQPTSQGTTGQCTWNTACVWMERENRENGKSLHNGPKWYAKYRSKHLHLFFGSFPNLCWFPPKSQRWEKSVRRQTILSDPRNFPRWNGNVWISIWNSQRSQHTIFFKSKLFMSISPHCTQQNTWGTRTSEMDKQGLYDCERLLCTSWLQQLRIFYWMIHGTCGTRWTLSFWSLSAPDQNCHISGH